MCARFGMIEYCVLLYVTGTWIIDAAAAVERPLQRVGMKRLVFRVAFVYVEQ